VGRGLTEVTKDDDKMSWERRFPTNDSLCRTNRITPPLVRAIP
jgi:hypothetical protein